MQGYCKLYYLFSLHVTKRETIDKIRTVSITPIGVLENILSLQEQY